jgi:SAM-dependent methyltransferase
LRSSLSERVACAAAVSRRLTDPRLRPRRSTLRFLAGPLVRGYAVSCNICGGHAADYQGGRHSEMAVCPFCGSIARDRFLYQCWTSRTPYDSRARLLETSPRLGEGYRERMAQLVRYTCSDYDMGAHSTPTFLDLQDLRLPDESLDVVLTAHVLEHVPDTGRALGEIRRTLAPGGVAFILVPVAEGKTVPPSAPEFHADDTPVFWRFGWDLSDMLADAGFESQILVTEPFRRAVAAGATSDLVSAERNERDLLALAPGYLDRMIPVADDTTTALLGLEAGSMLIAFEARKPPTGRSPRPSQEAARVQAG